MCKFGIKIGVVILFCITITTCMEIQLNKSIINYVLEKVILYVETKKFPSIRKARNPSDIIVRATVPTLIADDLLFFGKVVDAFGNGIDDVQVHWTLTEKTIHMPNYVKGCEVTDSSGKFRISINKNGQLLLAPFKKGYVYYPKDTKRLNSDALLFGTYCHNSIDDPEILLLRKADQIVESNSFQHEIVAMTNDVEVRLNSERGSIDQEKCDLMIRVGSRLSPAGEYINNWTVALDSFSDPLVLFESPVKMTGQKCLSNVSAKTWTFESDSRCENWSEQMDQTFGLLDSAQNVYRCISVRVLMHRAGEPVYISISGYTICPSYSISQSGVTMISRSVGKLPSL